MTVFVVRQMGQLEIQKRPILDFEPALCLRLPIAYSSTLDIGNEARCQKIQTLFIK